MPKFRKKPVIIEAIRCIGVDPGSSFPFEPEAKYRQENTFSGGYGPAVFDFLHQTYVQFQAGDWIIKGLKGEFYPCTDEVFKASYEEVSE